MKKTKKAGAIKSETLVNFILDKSGSMSSVQDSTISGFNEYVDTLKKDGNKYSFSLVFFDTEVKQTYNNKPIKEVEKMTRENYIPDGMTALYDAVCKTIKDVQGTVKDNQKVLTVIMTDGEENSSKEYSQAQLKSLIADMEKTGKWSFVFLGANQDSWANAQKIGVSQMNTSNFAATDAGVKMAMHTMAANTRAFAGNDLLATSAFFSQADQRNLGGSPQTGMTSNSQDKISQHFSALGNKSWEARKKKLLGEE